MDGRGDMGDASRDEEVLYLYLYQVPYHHAMRLNGRVMVCDRRGDGADEDEDVSDL